MMNVVDYQKTNFLTMHASFELTDLNYDGFRIEIVPCIPTTFNSDMLFELPPFVTPNGHFY